MSNAPKKNYAERKAALLENPSISYWLKDAVVALEKRDPLDALSDAAFLYGLATTRANEALGRST